MHQEDEIEKNEDSEIYQSQNFDTEFGINVMMPNETNEEIIEKFLIHQYHFI